MAVPFAPFANVATTVVVRPHFRPSTTALEGAEPAGPGSVTTLATLLSVTLHVIGAVATRMRFSSVASADTVIGIPGGAQTFFVSREMETAARGVTEFSPAQPTNTAPRATQKTRGRVCTRDAIGAERASS